MLEKCLIFGPGILDEKNAACVGLFSATFQYKVIQAGIHTLPPGSGHVFLDRSQKVIDTARAEGSVAYLIDEQKGLTVESTLALLRSNHEGEQARAIAQRQQSTQPQTSSSFATTNSFCFFCCDDSDEEGKPLISPASGHLSRVAMN